jgi:hypothetical protein
MAADVTSDPISQVRSCGNVRQFKTRTPTPTTLKGVVMKNQKDITMFTEGLGIGQSWTDQACEEVCRVVAIDPALRLVEIEDQRGRLESDTIEHFLSTHRAAS